MNVSVDYVSIDIIIVFFIVHISCTIYARFVLCKIYIFSDKILI